MKILLDDQGDRIRVVENQELGYYELRFGMETAGTSTIEIWTIDGSSDSPRSDRIFARGLATILIRTVLDDLEMQEAHVTNYCPAIDHYLRKHPEHHGLIDSRQPGMSDPTARR